MELGVVLAGDFATLAAQARRAEDAGFGTAWCAETDRDSMLQAAVAAQATTRIGIGTDITVAFPRSPTVTAVQAWNLDELCGGRFTVGLGSQVRRIVHERYSAPFDPPAARMAEYVQAMRTVWALERGERARFEGEHYRVLRAGLHGPGDADRRPPPVYVAAVGPLMTRVAATHADGLLGHPFTSVAHLRSAVLPRVEQALGAAGREREELRICQGVLTCVAEDRDVAVREAKQQIAFYGTTPNYREVLASYGDEALMARFREAFARRGPDRSRAMADAVPDEVVERYAVAGTPEEVAGRLSRFEGLADQLVLSGAWFGVPAARIAENVDAIVTALAR